MREGFIANQFWRSDVQPSPNSLPFLQVDSSGRSPLEPEALEWLPMPDGEGNLEFAIRGFKPSDAPAVQALYRQGLVGGKIAENDTALDLDDVQGVYMSRPGNHFWVAVVDGEIIGTIGVQHYPDDATGEIRRLRVARDFRRRGIGSALVETAIKFCTENQYLKVKLDTFMEHEPAIKLFEKFRFRHDRTKSVAGKDCMYFYMDLYTGPSRPHKEDGFSQPHNGAR